jgi:hypothetical protein
MVPFKFFQRKSTPQGANHYLSFDMDVVLLNVMRYKQSNNIPTLNSDTPFEFVNVPINGWIRINNWRNYENQNPQMIEIDYSVIEINTTATNFTLRMDLNEFVRRIDIRGI